MYNNISTTYCFTRILVALLIVVHTIAARRLATAVCSRLHRMNTVYIFHI